MLISVVIPNYNCERYLTERIESVLNQTYQNIEVIILDDCSSDNSKAIIEEYRHHDKVTQIVYNEKNSGSVFRQWRKGIEMASGEFVWIAESDDFAEPGFLEELVSGCTGQTAISYCQSVLFTGNKIVGKTDENQLYQELRGKDWVGNYMLGHCGLCNASMAIFNRQFALSIDWNFIDFELCGDWFFWTKMATKGTVAISGKYLNYFRRHPQSASNTPSMNGVFYSEGLKIFKYSVEKFGLEKDVVQTGLEKFAWHLYNDVSGIDKPEIKTKAFEELALEDPILIKEYFRRHDRAARTSRIKNGIKSLFRLIMPRR